MTCITSAQEMYQATDGACNAAAGAVLRYWHDARTAVGDGAEVSADILPKNRRPAGCSCPLQYG